MARPRSIRTDQILEAAREVFLSQGMRAPTSVIAKAAGVSEGTIFKRFPTKQHLFFAAMGVPASLATEPDKLLAGRAGQGDVREHLVEISMEIVTFLRVLVPRMMMMCAHPAYDPVKLFKGAPEPPPLRIARAVGQWLDGEATAGRARVADGDIVARMLMGALHNFVFFEISGIHGDDPPDAEEYARRLVDLLWAGISPHNLPVQDEARDGRGPGETQS